MITINTALLHPSLMSNTHADSNVAISIIPPPVLLTPRPMTDEELAMPMTAAPANEGTSEVSPLASSDSGICPPSSKKARTTSLSTAMKQSQLKSTNDDNNVEVVDAEVEGATANEEIKRSLCRPEALVLDINKWLGSFSFTVKLVSEIMRAF